MTTLGVRQVISEQAGNPDIYSVFARLSFLHRFRDQLPPGGHNFWFPTHVIFTAVFVGKTLATILGVMIACGYGVRTSMLS